MAATKGVMTKSLTGKLTKFLVEEIEGRVSDGITYMMVMKDPREKAMHKELMAIKDEALSCGFKADEIFRVYEVTNGYVFDMDINLAKAIAVELTKIEAKRNNGATPVGDLIGSLPEKRRREDIVGLGKYIKAQYREGKKSVEVALFSRNTVPKIKINVDDSKGNPVIMTYNAFAIRHWDLEEVNTSELIPQGISIKSIEACEILPSRTGVRFVLHFDKV